MTLYTIQDIDSIHKSIFIIQYNNRDYYRFKSDCIHYRFHHRNNGESRVNMGNYNPSMLMSPCAIQGVKLTQAVNIIIQHNKRPIGVISTPTNMGNYNPSILAMSLCIN